MLKIMMYKLWDQSKKDLENYRVKSGKLETTDKSRWLETGEKIMYNSDTGEVRVKNV